MTGWKSPRAELPVQLAARGVEVFGCEQEIVFDDGTTFTCTATPRLSTTTRDNPAARSRPLSTSHSRRKAEADLRASEQRFRELADAMPQIVWTAGPDGAIDYCNRRWFEITGHRYTPGAEENWRAVDSSR